VAISFPKVHYISQQYFNVVLQQRIFGPKRDEVTGDWSKLHNEELHNLYSSPSIIRMIKSRRMRWAGHVAQMGEKRNAYWWESQKEGDHWEDQGVSGRTILKWISETAWDGMDWIGLVQDRDQWRVLVNMVISSIKCWEILE
jgi:hypothetical protein